MNTGMSIEEAIRGRRTVGRVTGEEVAQELIEAVLEAGNWAPSHHGTEPWRFFVMRGSGRQRLADAYADIAAEGAKADEPAALDELRRKNGTKAYRAPVIIAVAVSPSEAKGVSRIEEFAATHSAVQNMLLMTHALGLGGIWRSGEPMYHPRMKEAFALTEREELVGLLYIGFPEKQPPDGKRRPVEEKTVWFTD
ncbi:MULTISPECIES: nitroreductase family protein [Paenibacillus]|uniref:nitroreductase family protein n=1 Tax=Paenibacillus TaxID=44249 RepID=UPI0022B9158F|nr:nitroreductase [Paenibacillus caseinilyticus]MCZ8518706.1 nitroreductase [Paenibacillus caseinilyticus]